MFPKRFSALPEPVFPRLKALLAHHRAGGPETFMDIGEPQHPIPDFVHSILHENIQDLSHYPPNNGSPELLNAICLWVQKRYNVAVEPERAMVLNGTREGLVNAVLALGADYKNSKKTAILMPNPFYQAYSVGALCLGLEPVYVPATAQTGYLPDYENLPKEILNKTTIAYICSPANPQGSIASKEYLHRLFQLAEKYDFRVFSDECYSEIWRDAPPPGAIEVIAAGGFDAERGVIFNSLSKRSNLPGLRSGFVLSGPQSMKHIRQLRAFGGAPVSLLFQRIAQKAWQDENHVAQSRALYQKKFQIADDIFANIYAHSSARVSPEGGFFLWLKVPGGDGEAASIKIWRETGVRVLPGLYLSRETATENPGKDHIRIALVTSAEVSRDALGSIRDCLYR